MQGAGRSSGEGAHLLTRYRDSAVTVACPSCKGTGERDRFRVDLEHKTVWRIASAACEVCDGKGRRKGDRRKAAGCRTMKAVFPEVIEWAAEQLAQGRPFEEVAREAKAEHRIRKMVRAQRRAAVQANREDAKRSGLRVAVENLGSRTSRTAVQMIEEGMTEREAGIERRVALIQAKRHLGLRDEQTGRNLAIVEMAARGIVPKEIGLAVGLGTSRVRTILRAAR